MPPSTMDHSLHAGHSMHMDMPPTPRCKMNMLWNTDIIDTCVVFRSWHIRSHTGFFWSLIAIVALGVLYEYLRVFQRKLDWHIAQSLQAKAKAKGRDRSGSRSGSAEGSGRNSPSGEGSYEEMGLLSGRQLLNIRLQSLSGTQVPAVSRALRAFVYGVQVFLSFFLMLVFMTYNAYLIAAVVVGAALGHYIFGSTINVDAILGDSAGGKGMACH